MTTEQLLQEIRERFTYCVDSWREIREEAAKDMRYVSGDPWDPKERAARLASGRPCLSLDELGQYTNKLINDIRSAKRAIKLIPRGDGADEKSAEWRAGLIRQIEYRSNAQAVYTCAAENMANRSYGYARVSKQYVSPDSFEQEIVLRRIANPDTVYVDPDAKEADFSDMGYAFVIEHMRLEEFRKRWPKAKVQSFSAELANENPGWIKEHDIQVAEYWRVGTVDRTLLLLDAGDGNPQKAFLQDLPGAQVKEDALVLQDGTTARILRRRISQDRKVTQYITNGFEILEENPWDTEDIPIAVCIGKELYVDNGGGTKRVLESLIRKARDPQMLYCYYRTCQAEIVGQVPKVPYVGYEGQFEGHEDDWQNVNKVPVAYLEAKPMVDAAGNTTLPLPRREMWEPPIQALELGAEGARRAIQSSVGIMGLANGRVGQDYSARSGIALKTLDQQTDQGNFHFIDNFDRFLQRLGKIVNNLISKVYDTPREEIIRKPDDAYQTIRVNQPYKDPKTGEETNYQADQGTHDVTVSTGPSFQSQREEASAFADTLAGIETIFPRVADLVVKLKNLGPIGDEIAKRLTPPDIAGQEGQQEIPPQVQQAMGQLQQQLKAINEYAKSLEGELQQAKSAENLKRMELESRERIAAINAQVSLIQTEAQLSSREGIELLKAELATIKDQLSALSQPVAEPTADPAAAAPPTEFE